MSTRQQRWRAKKKSEGCTEISLLLTAQELAELDRRALEEGSRLKAVQRWLYIGASADN